MLQALLWSSELDAVIKDDFKALNNVLLSSFLACSRKHFIKRILGNLSMFDGNPFTTDSFFRYYFDNCCETCFVIACLLTFAIFSLHITEDGRKG